MIGPSAVEGKGTSARATKKGNAQLNNMTDITIPSISYIATIVCDSFAMKIKLTIASRFILG
jgi:Family of unknown function (DUF6698)